MSEITGASSAVSHLRHRTAAQRVSQDLFKKIDSSGDGAISKTELEGAVTGAGGTQASADTLFSTLDPNNTGSVSQSQFLSGFSALAFSPQNGAQLIEAQAQSTSASADPAAGFKQNLFSQLDADGDGALTQAEVEKAVTAGGGTKESADALYAKLDPDGTGSVSAAQFSANLPRPPGPPGAPPGPPPADGDADQTGGVTAQDAMRALLQSADPAKKAANDLFARLDANGDGVLSKDEVQQAVTAVGGTKDQADALYAKLDPNGTGAVTEQQFASALPHHHHHRSVEPPDGTDGTVASSSTGGSSSATNAIDALLQSLSPAQQSATAAVDPGTDAAGATAGTTAATSAASDSLEAAIAALLNGSGATSAISGDSAILSSFFGSTFSPPAMSALLNMQNPDLMLGL